MVPVPHGRVIVEAVEAPEPSATEPGKPEPPRWKLVESKVEKDGKWVDAPLAADEELDATKLESLKFDLRGLVIVDVDRKEEFLAKPLREKGTLPADGRARSRGGLALRLLHVPRSTPEDLEYPPPARSRPRRRRSSCSPGKAISAWPPRRGSSTCCGSATSLRRVPRRAKKRARQAEPRGNRQGTSRPDELSRRRRTSTASCSSWPSSIPACSRSRRSCRCRSCRSRASPPSPSPRSPSGPARPEARGAKADAAKKDASGGAQEGRTGQEG